MWHIGSERFVAAARVNRTSQELAIHDHRLGHPPLFDVQQIDHIFLTSGNRQHSVDRRESGNDRSTEDQRVATAAGDVQSFDVLHV